MSRDAGFSLVEVLAAVLVFAIVGTVSTGLLVTSLDAKDRHEAALDRLSSVQQVRALLRDDAAQMLDRPARAGRDGEPLAAFRSDAGLPGLARAGEGTLLLGLMRRGRANPGGAEPRSSLQRVDWRLEDGVLVREVWPLPDTAPDAAPERLVLAEGLSEVAVEFFQAGVWRNAPLRAAGGDAPPPAAVRLRYLDAAGRPMEHVVITAIGEARA
jgi:general secretion pathway protein J